MLGWATVNLDALKAAQEYIQHIELKFYIHFNRSDKCHIFLLRIGIRIFRRHKRNLSFYFFEAEKNILTLQFLEAKM